MGNIIITFLRINDAQNIRNILVRNGWGNVSICTSGAGTLAMADQLESGVVICGYRLPDMAYMQLKEDLPAGFQMLLIASNSVMTGASSAEVTHMETPLKVQELIQTIHFMEEDAARRRRKRRGHRQRLKPKERNPEETALIRQAKELLMKSNHISEDEAHKYLLRTSMQSGRNLFETAQMVLLLKNK